VTEFVEFRRRGCDIIPLGWRHYSVVRCQWSVVRCSLSAVRMRRFWPGPKLFFYFSWAVIQMRFGPPCRFKLFVGLRLASRARAGMRLIPAQGWAVIDSRLEAGGRRSEVRCQVRWPELDRWPQLLPCILAIYQPIEKRHRGVFQPRQARSKAPRGSQNRDLGRGFDVASMRHSSPLTSSTGCYSFLSRIAFDVVCAQR
jgi:hypothetical protein